MAFASVAECFGEGTGILMGLGYPSMAAYSFTPFFDHVMNLQVLPSNIFSFWLSLNQNTPSRLVFGKTEPEYYEGEIEYFPVVDKQFWTILMIDVKVSYSIRILIV